MAGNDNTSWYSFYWTTDDEVCDIDGGNVADDEVSDEYTTNTGII